MKEQVLLDIICAIKRFLENGEPDKAKEYVELEIKNILGLTPEDCKNTKYHFWPTYCKYCNIVRCPDNQNQDLK